MSSLRPFQPDDVFQLRFPTSGAFSPDGAQVVYSVRTTDLDALKDIETLWLYSIKMGEHHPLTEGSFHDTNPCWLPDGKYIVFRSTRKDKPQLFIISQDGSQLRQLTTLEQGVGGTPTSSPNGLWIAFTAAPNDSFPDPKEPYRIRRAVYRFDDIGYIEPAIQEIFIIPTEGGEPCQLTHQRGICSELHWSPDSNEILYLSNFSPGDSHNAFLPTIKLVDLQGNVHSPLPDHWGAEMPAAWMPDGGHIVFAGIPSGRPLGGIADLYVVDRNGSIPENRTPSLDLHLGNQMHNDLPARDIQANILISSDSEYAFVPVQERGAVPLYRVSLSGPEDWSPCISGERACIPLDIKENRLLFTASSLSNPLELYSADVDGLNEKQVTYLNESFLNGIELPKIEHIMFTGEGNVEVEGWYMRPPRGDAPYPTILHIHGGPHSTFGHSFYFDQHMYAGAGYGVLFINHRGSSGYGERFACSTTGDWGNLDFKDLMAAIDLVITNGWADPHRLGVGGISAGGNLTAWIVSHTDRFKAAVSENPVINMLSFFGTSDIGPLYLVEEMGGLPWDIPDIYRRCSPITYAHQCKTPTLIIQSENDWRCPPEQAEQFYTVLKFVGCVTEMLRFPSSSHGAHARGRVTVRRMQNQAQLEWMNRYVLGNGTSPS